VAAAVLPVPPPIPQSGATQAMLAADTTAIRRALSKEPSRALRLSVLPAIYLLQALRKAIGWTAGVYSFACIALFALSLLATEQLRALAFVLPLLHRFLDPGLAVVGSFLPFPLIFQNADFLPVAVGLALYLAQLGVTGGLEKAEAALRRIVERKPPTAAAVFQIQQQHRLATPASASRMSLLREYAVAKRMLSEAQKEMAFLAVDVAGSTKMKLGEEKISIEHAFAEYKKFLERIFRECRVYKVAWTPDGVMTCFSSADDATTAGRKIITDLDFFNRDVHQLRTKFRVRAGVNIGVVLIPEDKPLEEISDHTIDVAGHLQKEAEVDTLWVSSEVHERLMDRSGFTRMDTQVDGHEVFAWRRPV